jgi:predicted transcriptional regulator
VADVREALAGRGIDLAYTTVATLVRILCEKGFVEPVNDERPFRYRAVRTYEEVSRRLLDDLLDRVFGGSREELLLRLVESRRLTAKERAALAQLLREVDR